MAQHELVGQFPIGWLISQVADEIAPDLEGKSSLFDRLNKAGIFTGPLSEMTEEKFSQLQQSIGPEDTISFGGEEIIEKLKNPTTRVIVLEDMAFAAINSAQEMQNRTLKRTSIRGGG